MWLLDCTTGSSSGGSITSGDQEAVDRCESGHPADAPVLDPTNDEAEGVNNDEAEEVNEDATGVEGEVGEAGQSHSEGQEASYEILKIKRHYTKRGQVLFVVQWKGFGVGGDTEEPASNICSDPKFHNYVSRVATRYKGLCECEKCE